MTMSTIPEPAFAVRFREALFPRGTSVRKIAIPVEHGGWGILFEPIVLGLIAAFSPAGLLIGLGAVAAFFARQPLKLALIDRSRSKSYPRTRTAWSLTVLFAAGSILLVVGGAALGGWRVLIPLAAAGPFALVQIVYDARNDSRRILPEVCGAVAMSAVAMSTGLAGGLGAVVAGALWLFMVARSVPAILYVRARVRIERNVPANAAAPILAHAGALAAAVLLVARGLAPAVAATVLVVLLARCAIGLSSLRRAASPQRIGFTEIAYGAGAVIATGIGYVRML